MPLNKMPINKIEIKFCNIALAIENRITKFKKIVFKVTNYSTNILVVPIANGVLLGL